MADAFGRLMGRLDYPMLLVTVASGGRRAGCLVGVYTQTSIHPQRLLVGLSDKNLTTRVAADADATSSPGTSPEATRAVPLRHVESLDLAREVEARRRPALDRVDPPAERHGTQPVTRRAHAGQP